MELITDTFDKMYPMLLKHVYQDGRRVEPRGLKTVEVSPIMFQLTDPEFGMLTIPERGLNYYFMLMECVWMLLGSDDAKFLSFFNKNILKFSDDGRVMAGAYGPKIVGQMDYVIKTLEDDPNSRQALMTLWKENPGPSKDIPCTIFFHFLVRAEKLNLIVYMRSNDLWLGTPYDVFNFTTIQRLLAQRLELLVGTYTHVAGSLHLYEKDFNKLQKVLDADPTQYTVSFPVNHHIRPARRNDPNWFSIFNEFIAKKTKHYLGDMMVITDRNKTMKYIDSLELTDFWQAVFATSHARAHKMPEYLYQPFSDLQRRSDKFRNF